MLHPGLRSFLRKSRPKDGELHTPMRESRITTACIDTRVPAFRLRAPRFDGLESAEAREASVGWVAGRNGE
jgi:hypothetical protein